MDAKRIKLNMERENILNRLWDEYELTYSAAEEIKTARRPKVQRQKQKSKMKRMHLNVLENSNRV